MDKSPARDASHVFADSHLASGRIRVLKHGDTFALFDEWGDIRPDETGESGVYHDGTRFLSRFQLQIEGNRPFLLSSTVRDDNDQLVVTLTNPDLFRDGHAYMPLGLLHFEWRKLLWKGVLHQQLRIDNHGMACADFAVTMGFGADFADIYEIRGMRRKARGRDLDPEVSECMAILQYRGLDSVVRRTIVQFASRPTRLTPSCASFELQIAPRKSALVEVAVVCERDCVTTSLSTFEGARVGLRGELESETAQYSRIETDSGQFNALVKRATADLRMLTTVLPTGPYPYAGVPWFNTPFGRDGIITAIECLWLNPSLARGVLAYLSQMQATEIIPEQDAEPGKILHETRHGEMAVLGEMPFARYYGTVDATPLFVMLAGAYLERTTDCSFIEAIWPNLQAALLWMEHYGDCDEDGLIEYPAHTRNGLLHQGWKDSDDAVLHADGSPAEGPIALCEVQAYVYGAWRSAARMAAVLRLPELESRFSQKAEELREHFEETFWCEDLSLYALALDGHKRPCRVRTSNAGQCLLTGIASADRAARVAEALLRPECFSGWGIRTLAMAEPRYNPMGYHTGSVWPHDNALIAYGMKHYGISSPALRIFTGFFDAAMTCDLYRIPELYCGFPRRQGEGPIAYPVACAPQAWSAAALFLLLQASLGIKVNALEQRITLFRPSLPPFLRQVAITGLVSQEATADLLIVRHEEDVSIHILGQNGKLDVVVLP